MVRDIRAIGAEPLIVLGFYSWTLETISSAPSGMSNNPDTGLPYPEQWGAYCGEWVKHFEEVGLEVTYYEIINEPYHYFEWPAKEPKLGYFIELFNAASVKMKNFKQDVKIGNDASTMKNVLNAFISKGEPIGFISFHRYGFANLEDSDSKALTNAETLYMSETSTFYAPKQAVEVYQNAKGITVPLLNSEGSFSDEYDPVDPRTQTMLGAVYTALSLRTYVLNDLRYSVYFHMAGKSESMGMVNVDTYEPYYPYLVHKIIGNSLDFNDKLYSTSAPSSDVRSLAWVHDAKQY